RHLGRRGPAGEPDDLPLGDEGRGGEGDRLLRVAVAGDLVLQRELVGGAHRDRAAVRAGDEAALGERVEVAPGGRRGDVERRHDVVDVDLTVLGEQIEDLIQTLLSGHRRDSSTVRVRTRNDRYSTDTAQPDR